MKSIKSSKLWLLSAAVLSGWVSFPVCAGEVQGTVKYVLSRDSDGVLAVEINGARSGAPACAKYEYFMIRDENSTMGKRQYATLLAAKLAGKTVYIMGRNTCARWPDGEDIDTVKVLD